MQHKVLNITVNVPYLMALSVVLLHSRYDKQLPDYLRPYTAGAVHIRIMSLCVELLQYRRQYREAVDLLEELINQDVYHTEYRGRWYDRLALNLDHHLKQHSKVSNICEDGI